MTRWIGGRLALASAVAATMLVSAWGASAAVVWTRVGSGITAGISGAAAASSGWVVVRDSKSAGQNRIALLSRAGVLTSLTWPGTAPQDLEAIAAIPNQPGRYAAVTSTGQGTVVAVSGTTVTKVSSFVLPRGSSDIEGLAIVRIKDTNVAVWAKRGASATPATVYAATFKVSASTFGPVVTGNVRVPYPTSNVRHVADLAYSGGKLLGAAASDPGDNGPFDSALYDLGSVGLSAGKATLTLKTPRSLAKYAGHKVEAVACSGATGLLGSDDENKGGWITSHSFC